MSTFDQKYKIRSGTVDSGKEYEAKIAALLSLRCVLHGVDEMWIASNADGVGDFDDIILHVKTAEIDGITFMMQLKHKDKPNNIQEQALSCDSGDFSLKAYSQDISKLQQSISTNPKVNIVKHLGQFDDIYFVLFTNRGESKNSKILYNINNPNKSVCFLQDVLNTNTTTNNLFGFNLQTLPKIASNNNFKNAFLLANQLSSKHLDEQISVTIKDIVNHSGSAKVDFKSVAKNFIQFVKDWARGTLGGHYCLTKRDVLTKISDLFLNTYAVNLRQNQFNFYDCNKKNIWNRIVSKEFITVIDSNDVVLEFLAKYIGSEVRKYCDVSNINYWTENLSDQAQTIFYDKHQDLKKQMLKIVGNHDKITLLDVYKCLWMVEKLPLILEVTGIQDYENIVHALTFSNYSCKVIIVNKSTDILPANQIGINTFSTLQDLHSAYKDVILKLPIKLQGRAGVALENLINENMYQYVTCNDIISILLENFNIGNNLEQLPPYFIERSFIKMFIKAQALREIHDDVFLFDNSSDKYDNFFPENDFNACKLGDVDYNNMDNYRVILLQENDTREVIERLKSTNKSIHYLLIHDADCLEWKWTLGRTGKLRSFQIRLKDMCQKDIAPYFYNAVNIVSDEPGMGKSMLMNFIEREAPTDNWVVRINLLEHQKYYRKGNCTNSKSNAQEHLSYFNDLLRPKHPGNTKLSQMVFKKLLDAKNVIVLLDGFDEVSVSYKDEVTELATCLYTKGYHIWITTRPHMQSHLERTFDVFSFTLKPFDKNDQELFLKKYFSAINNDLLQRNLELLLEKFVKQLLEASKKNLSDEDAKFAGIPLQSKLLADAFNDDCRNYLNSKGFTSFDTNFDLLDLYQNFVDKKFDIFYEKYGENAADTHSTFRKHQFHFALKYLFSSNTLLELDIENEFKNDYKKEPKVIEFLQRDGVIMVDEKLNVSCTHQTFAEYLAALWLTQNLNSESKKIKETVDVLTAERFDGHYEFLFGIFDRILAKKYPLHSAIINSRTEEVIQAIKVNPNVLKDVDDGNRSVLHLIALYSKRFPVHFEIDEEIMEEFNSDNMLDIISAVPDGVILEIDQDLLGYSPFDYALAYNSLTVANKLHAILKIPIFKRYKDLSLNNNSLAYCAMLNYEKLFKILLPYFVSEDFLLNLVSKDSNVTTYIAKRWFFPDFINNIQDYVMKLYKGITVFELLHSADGYPYTGYQNGFYSDIHHAVISGTEENVNKLLSLGQNINKKDIQEYTLLHYAGLHKRVGNTHILIDNGANVNAQTCAKATPLHFAIDKNEIKSKKVYKCFNASDRRCIVAKLLTQGANPNSLDYYGDSPLHFASINGYTDIVKLLIQYDANTNLKSKLNQHTPLRCAIEGCYISTASNALGDNNPVYKISSDGESIGNLQDEITLHCANKTGQKCTLTDLLNRGTPINRQSVIECASIPCLYESCHYCTIVQLMCYGADINEQYTRERTPLHEELYKQKEFFDVNIAKLLIVYGADVNKPDFQSQTALHYSIKRGHTSILRELLINGADVNKQDTKQNTPLHLTKNGDTARVLISNGADVNAENNEGQTPCHKACQYKYSSTIEELIASGADINKQDNDGHTTLHSLICQQPFVDHSGNAILRTAKLLIANGADINIQNKNGQTALHYASKSGYSSIVRELLINGADDNKQDTEGNTPLHLTKNGDTACILISNGANVNAKNNKGQTPCHNACQYKYSSTIEELIASGADINNQDNDGHTPFHSLFDPPFRIDSGKAILNAAKLLIANDADINIQNKNGKTALHSAVKNTCNYTLIPLLSNGANTNIQDGDGNTPLHFVKYKAVADLLIHYGADTNIKNNEGETPSLNNL